MPAAPQPSARPVAVPDINVLVSALIGRRDVPTPPSRIVAAWRRGELTFALSMPMLNKADEVLRRPSLRPFLEARFSPERVEERTREFLQSLARQARVTRGILDLRAVEKDPEDNTIIIAAVESRAECIISGDAHLKNLGTYEDILILSPAEFVDRYHIS